MSEAGISGRHQSSPEREDVLAYLVRRRENCALVAANTPEFFDHARALERQLDILIDEIRHGLHHGEAEVAKWRAKTASREGAAEVDSFEKGKSLPKGAVA